MHAVAGRHHGSQQTDQRERQRGRNQHRQCDAATSRHRLTTPAIGQQQGRANSARRQRGRHHRPQRGIGGGRCMGKHRVEPEGPPESRDDQAQLNDGHEQRRARALVDPVWAPDEHHRRRQREQRRQVAYEQESVGTFVDVAEAHERDQVHVEVRWRGQKAPQRIPPAANAAAQPLLHLVHAIWQVAENRRHDQQDAGQAEVANPLPQRIRSPSANRYASTVSTATTRKTAAWPLVSVCSVKKPSANHNWRRPPPSR